MSSSAHWKTSLQWASWVVSFVLVLIASSLANAHAFDNKMIVLITAALAGLPSAHPTRSCKSRPNRVIPLFERHAIVMGPAKAVWGLLAFCSLFFVSPFLERRLWVGYGFAVGCLQALASLMMWVTWSTDGRALLGFLALSAVYLGVVALQCQVWWQDLRHRCPCCLESFLLGSTEGSAACLLLNPNKLGIATPGPPVAFAPGDDAIPLSEFPDVRSTTPAASTPMTNGSVKL
jgi:hypothetical protein